MTARTLAVILAVAMAAPLAASAYSAGLLDDTPGPLETSARVAPVADAWTPSASPRPAPPVRITTTTTSRPPVSALCPQWWPTARRAGWRRTQLPRVDQIMWRESRCIPTVRSSTRDSGLMQVNDIHLGWLAGYGITQADLLDPATNLRAARLLYRRAAQMFGCGWQPWGSC